MWSHLRVVGAVVPLILLSQGNALSVQRFQEGPSFDGQSVLDSARESEELFVEDPSSTEKHKHGPNYTRTCPSIFVAVVSSLDNAQRRNEIRAMWKTAGTNYESALQYKYALCTRGSDGAPEGAVTEALRQEQAEHGDVLFMDCEEGYLNGLLTRKVAESMRLYVSQFSNLDLYMKIDDDTFISTDKLCDFMDYKHKQGVNFHKAYVGVFSEGNERVAQKHAVIRDEESPWFEPPEKFAEEEYPTSAKGGPGYILPMATVKYIIKNGIDKDYELNNEDKAVGYWVRIVKQKGGGGLTYVNMQGTDGYEEHDQWIKKKGPWRKYPHVVHHHLDGKVIDCLHKIEFSNDPETLIGPCFTSSLFGSREKHVRIHMPY